MSSSSSKKTPHEIIKEKITERITKMFNRLHSRGIDQETINRLIRETVQDCYDELIQSRRQKHEVGDLSDLLESSTLDNDLDDLVNGVQSMSVGGSSGKKGRN